MTKATRIHRLAVKAGLPESIRVTYNRHGQRWYLEYPVALGTDAELGHPTTIMASYASIGEAEEMLPIDVEQFRQHYRRILAVLEGRVEQLSPKEAKLLLDADRMQGYRTLPDPDYRALLKEGVVKVVPQPATNAVLYQLTMLGQRLVREYHTDLSHQATSAESTSASREVTLQYNNVTDDEKRSALYTLLDQVEQGWPVARTLVSQARDYLARLEDQVIHRKQQATGRYTSRHPDAKTTLIAWDQPEHRQVPVYDHAVVCAVCGEATTIRNHSPNPPAVCERESCRDEHTRLLARRRKRRQRARVRQSEEDMRS